MGETGERQQRHAKIQMTCEDRQRTLEGQRRAKEDTWRDREGQGIRRGTEERDSGWILGGQRRGTEDKQRV